jgi:hypothetical protein
MSAAVHSRKPILCAAGRAAHSRFMYPEFVRHDQLAGLGVTAGMLRWWLGTGRWQQALPAVYASFGGRLSVQQRWIAACLYAGPGATLTGRAALQWHGVRALPVDPWVRVLVPHARQVPSVDYVRVHRTRRLEPGDPGARLRFCPLPRAVADAGRWCGDLRALRALVDEVTGDGRTTVDALRQELDSGPAAGSALLRLVLSSTTGATTAVGRSIRVPA